MGEIRGIHGQSGGWSGTRRVLLPAAALAVVAAVVVPAWRGWNRGVSRVVAVAVPLDDGDRIEAGWEVEVERPKDWYPFPTFRSYLEWRHRGTVRTFLIFDGGDPVPHDVQLRASPAQTRIWVVDERREVVCTLDRRTGEYGDYGGGPRDGTMSLAEQAAEGGYAGGPEDRPPWATPDGGVVLGEGSCL